MTIHGQIIKTLVLFWAETGVFKGEVGVMEGGRAGGREGGREGGRK